MDKPATTTETPSVEVEAMTIIQKSGVLNPKMPLDEVMTLTKHLATLHASRKPTTGGIEAHHKDTFIHSHFIFTHED